MGNTHWKVKEAFRFRGILLSGDSPPIEVPFEEETHRLDPDCVLIVPRAGLLAQPKSLC